MDRTYLERVADRVGECSLGRGDRAAEQEGGRSRRCIIDMYECQHDSEIAFHIFDRTPLRPTASMWLYRPMSRPSSRQM